MGLRVEAKSGEVVFTWPLAARKFDAGKALRFIEENKSWIEKHRREAVPRKSFAAGDALCIAGRDCVIEHAPGRGLTRLDGGRLLVHGGAAHLPRRVKDFLKKHAAETLKSLSGEKARALGLHPSPVRILDPGTRWGSCAPDGRLMFSWRLLLAPYDVMDYVVAHEVAHRVHLDHSRRFWRLCAELTVNAGESRRWLRRHGRELMRWQ